MWNHYAFLPWLYKSIDPSLFVNDLLVEQYVNSPSALLPILVKLLPFFDGQIPLLFFAFYSLALAATIYAFYYLGAKIANDSRAGILAVVFLSFAFPVIGDVSLWDSLLMERTIGYPLLLLALLAMYRQNYWWAILLQGIAFNIHPLSAVYIISLTWLGDLIRRGIKKEHFLFLAVLSLLVSPALYLKLQFSEGASMIHFSETWMEVMRLRNGHHAFPSEYPLSIVLKSALVALAYFVLVWKGDFKLEQKKFLFGFGGGMMFLLALGVIFTEFYPIRIIIEFQFFRAFLFLVSLAIALWAGQLMRNPKPIFYLLALPFLAQYFYGEMAKSLAFVGLAFGAWFLLRFYRDRLRATSLISSGFLMIGLLALVMRGGFSIDEGKQNQDWYQLQDWVSVNTDPNALIILPPGEAGFRVRGMRSTYGDWYDGTKAFFSEEYAAHWLDHMSKVSKLDPDNLKEDYLALSDQDFLAIWEEEAKKYSEAYVVHYADAPCIKKLEPSFRAGDYVLYRLPSKENTPFLASN